MSYKQKSPLPIPEGGTNNTNFPNPFGVAYYDGSKLNNIPTGIAGKILTSNGIAAAPSFENPASSGFVWNNVTGTSVSAVINNGYIANNAGLVTVTLPATAAVGSVVSIQGSGAGGWSVAQNSGQTIRLNGGVSTTGVTGSIASTSQYDAISLICITANTDWSMNYSVGNFNVV